MRNLNTVGLLAGIALAVGMIGVNIADGTFVVFDKTSDVYQEAGMFLGHLEIIQTNADGNIIRYMQTDNAILSEGENCIARDLFGTGAGTSCTADPGVFDVIGLDDTTTVGSSQDALTLPSELTGNGLDRAAGTVSSQQEATGGGGTNIARIANTFTYTGGPAQSVLAAGLFNDTASASSAIFAMKNFPSSVTLNTSDQLTVNWDITISGTEAFS